MEDKFADPQLLIAVLNVAREECGHANWDELEPLLAEAWEELRHESTPPWPVVADEVQRACQRDGLLGD